MLTAMATANDSHPRNVSIVKAENVQTSSSEPQLVLQVLFSFIAVLAIFGNGFLCAVMLRDHRRFLRSSYNVFIFSLAVTDMVTGVTIPLTPGYIVGLDSYPVPPGVGGQLFCRVISTKYFIFVFGKVSVLTIVAMALERWYSIVKPLEYKLKFTRKRVRIYILIIWILSCLFNGSKPLRAELKESTLRCSWSEMSYPKEVFIPTYTTVTFFIPIVITWASFAHLSRVLNKSLAQDNKRFRNTRKRLTIMSAIVAFLLSACWFPNQVFFTLSAFDITNADSPLLYLTIVLAMFNSCVNPWVYYFTNREYKQGFKNLFGLVPIKSKSRPKRCLPNLTEIVDGSTDGVLVKFRYINSSFTAEL